MRLRARLTKQRLLAILICASVAMTALGPSVSGEVRTWFHWALAPLGDAGLYVTTTVKGHVGRGTRISEEDLLALRRERDALEGAVIELRRQRDALRRWYADISTIYRSIPPEDFKCELIPARVVGRESLPYVASGMLNAGSVRGVEEGAMVTTRNVLTDRAKALAPRPFSALATTSGTGRLATTCLVGRVEKTWAFGATLRLITDRGFEINALIYRIIDDEHPRMIRVLEPARAREERLTDANNAGVPAFARGDGGRLVAQVPANHNVQPGDMLATKRDEFLPGGVVIGAIEKVVPDADHPGFQIVYVEPRSDLETLRHVYVVVPTWPESRR